MEKHVYFKKIIAKRVFYIVPLFFLLTSLGTDYMKFFVLVFFLPLFIFVSMYSKKCFQKKIFHFYTYEKIIGLFILLSFFASILSANRFSSFFGDSHNHVFSFISIFIFISFFLYFSRLKELFLAPNRILKLLLYSSMTLFVYKIISAFFPVINIFKFTTEELIIIASLNILLFSPLLIEKSFLIDGRKYVKYFLLLLFFLISVVFYKPLFFVFAIIYTIQLLLLDKKIFSSFLKNKLFFLILFIFLFGTLLSIDSDRMYKIKQNNLNRSTSAKLVLSSLKTDFLFGRGFGSYSDYFSMYRPAEFNYDENWQIRFNNSHSFIYNLPISAGFLATLSFLFFIGFMFFIAIKASRSYLKKKNDNLYVSLLGPFLFVSLLPFLITFTYISFLLFSIFLAVFINYSIKNNYYESQKIVSKNKINIYLFCAYLFVFLWFILIAFNVKYLIADIYAKNYDEKSIKKAINLNNNFEEYNISLSRIYLNKAKSELKQANKDYGSIAKNVDEAKKWAEMAIKINPNSVAVYEALGVIYRDIANYSSNGEVYALGPLKKALSLEPTNPVLATEIGKLYLLQKDNENALKYFNKAHSLKSDYKDASLGLARVMIANNNNREAIALLEKIKTDNFNDSKIYFELGRAYFGMNNNEIAIENFQKSILFEPNNSNALYSLAVTYDRMGDRESAFLYYKKTQDLNPGNVKLIERINEINK